MATSSLPASSPRAPTAAASSIGPLDYFLGVAHVSLIASIFANVFSGNQYVAIATGVGEAGLILSHAYYRKYGNIGKSVEELKESEVRLHGDLRGERDIESGIEVTAGRVEMTVEDLRGENSQLTQSLALEKQNNELLMRQLVDFQEKETSLQQTVLELTARTTQMGQLVLEVRAEGNALAKNVLGVDQEEKKVDKSMADLEKVTAAINGAVSLFSTIEEEFKRNQESIGDLKRENQELQTEIGRLGGLLETFQKDEAGLDETVANLRKNIQELEGLRQKLLTEIAHLEEVQAGLQRDVAGLKAATETFTRERAALSTDEHKFEATLDKYLSQSDARTDAIIASNTALAERLRQQKDKS